MLTKYLSTVLLSCKQCILQGLGNGDPARMTPNPPKIRLRRTTPSKAAYTHIYVPHPSRAGRAGGGRGKLVKFLKVVKKLCRAFTLDTFRW